MAAGDTEAILFIGFILALALAGGAIVGYWLAKKYLLKVKWSDREGTLNAKWQTKLVTVEKNNELALQKLRSDLELQAEEKNTQHEKALSDWQARYLRDLNELKALFKESESAIRKKSVSASRRTLVGKFIERFVPFLKKFPYAPSDVHFLGQPVDYIVFDGLKDNKIEKVVFLEIKTGSSKLTAREKSLKDAIEKKKVRWQEIRIDTESESTPDDDIATEEDASDVYERIDAKLASVKTAMNSKIDLAPGDFVFQCPHCEGECMLEVDRLDVITLKKNGTIGVDCAHCDKSCQVDWTMLSEPEE